jgi:hypothetical protein
MFELFSIYHIPNIITYEYDWKANQQTYLAVSITRQWSASMVGTFENIGVGL